MANIATQIAEDLTEHGIDLARLEAGTSKKVVGIINNLAQQLKEDLIKINPTEPLRVGYREARSKVLLASANGKISDAYREINTILKTDLKKLAALDADTVADMANSPVGVDLVSGHLSTDTLNAIVNESKLFGGENLAQWLSAERTALNRAMKSVINKNILLGTPITQMVRELIGTKANNYKDGIMRISRARANTIVRTSVNAIANSARNQVYADNADVIKGKQWLATLDTRTCFVAGTAVLTSKGYKNIDLIVTGERIIDKDGNESAVLDTQSWYTHDLIELTLENGSVLTCTPDHKFLTDCGWVEAQYLTKEHDIQEHHENKV